MASSSAETPEAYLAELSPERRETVAGVREVILANLPEGYEEDMQYGMIGYHIPLDRFPDMYNGQPLGVAALASQKNHVSLYLLAVCDDPEALDWFEERFAASGKKLRMGKSCVRFKRLDDLPLDVIGEAIAMVPPDALIRQHQASHAR